MVLIISFSLVSLPCSLAVLPSWQIRLSAAKNLQNCLGTHCSRQWYPLHAKVCAHNSLFCLASYFQHASLHVCDRSSPPRHNMTDGCLLLGGSRLGHKESCGWVNSPCSPLPETYNNSSSEHDSCQTPTVTGTLLMLLWSLDLAHWKESF